MPPLPDDPVAEPRGAAGRPQQQHQQQRCRRVAASVVLVARCCAVARRRRRAAPIRGAASMAELPPTNDRRRPPRGDRPLPHRAPHRRVAQLAHPAGRSRMPIALHGLALRKASDAISPLNAVVEPGCCRTPPPSWRRAASAIISAAPARARARDFGASKVNGDSDGGQQAAPAGHAADRPRSGRRAPRARGIGASKGNAAHTADLSKPPVFHTRYLAARARRGRRPPPSFAPKGNIA